MIKTMEGHNMTNKITCDSCNEEVANDQWSHYTSDDNSKFCIDCGDDIQNDYIAECNADHCDAMEASDEENQ